jgi:hypothetical protein
MSSAALDIPIFRYKKTHNSCELRVFKSRYRTLRLEVLIVDDSNQTVDCVVKFIACIFVASMDDLGGSTRNF